MKKALIIFAVLSALSFAPAEDKKLKVELTLQQWQIIADQLDKSAAPHNEIKISIGWLAAQIEPQVKDTISKK